MKTPPKPSQNQLSDKPTGVGIAPLYRGKVESDAQKRVSVLVSENGSILAVARKLGLSQAYLSQIASGKRRASNRYRCALGLKPLTALAPVCAKCGVPHTTKRCTHKNTFEQNASAYDAWLKSKAQKLAEMVKWAESRTE